MASIFVILRLSIATLLENKLRSILTLIGMIFGNAAVIATLSSNDGAKIFIANQLATLGNKLMTVNLDKIQLDESDLITITRHADEIETVALEKFYGSATARYSHQVSEVRIIAASEEYLRAVNLTLDVGRAQTSVEEKEAEPLVILGSRVKDKLFRDLPFMNENMIVMIKDTPIMLRVIGTLREKGGVSGADLDNSIFISSTLATKIANSRDEKLILLLKDDNRTTIAKHQVQSLLFPKFGQTLQITDAREAIEKTKEIWAKQNLVGICLAGISLLTGGVGIMNIMLLSIHQRQKEIGLRKAVGARNSEIAIQFLLETVIICALGGILGVGVGWAFGRQVADMLGNWEANMSISSVMIAFSFSVMTGIIFGAMPAMRASRLDPYDALRTG